MSDKGLVQLSETNKFGFSERTGCSFLMAGLILLIILHIILPGLVLLTQFTGLIKYLDLFAYTFIIVALICLKSYSKLFLYAISAALAGILLAFAEVLLSSENYSAIYTLIDYIVKVLDFGILFLILAAINQYACKVKNIGLGEKCIRIKKLLIVLSVIVLACTFLLTLTKLGIVIPNFKLPGYFGFLGILLWPALILVPLAIIGLPIFIIFQFADMIRAFEESLKLRSYRI